MILKYYAIWDIKAQAHNTPFSAVNDDVALRTFSRVVNDPEYDIYAHAADYILCHVYDFDLLTAEVTVPSQPERWEALSFLKNTKPE